MAGHLTLAEQAIDCFGEEAQILKFAEECCESEENETDPSESADVLVCMDQMRIVFGDDLDHEIRKAKLKSCVVNKKALPRAAAKAIKYTLYLKAGWNTDEIKQKLIEAIALAEILLEFRIGKSGNWSVVEAIKKEKEARLLDTIYGFGSERNSGGLANISSGKASGI